MRNLFLFIALSFVGFVNAQKVVYTSDYGYSVTQVGEYEYFFNFDNRRENALYKFDRFFTGIAFNEKEFNELVTAVDNIVIEYRLALKKGRKYAKQIRSNMILVGWNVISRERDLVTVNFNVAKGRQVVREAELKAAKVARSKRIYQAGYNFGKAMREGFEEGKCNCN